LPYGCFDVDAEILKEERVDQPLLLAEILRDIGDWCMGLGISQHFEDAHVLSWDLLGLVEDGDRIRSEWFGAPTAIYTPELQARALSDRQNAPVGRIELSFTVDDDGSASRIEVVNADPEGILDKWAVKRVRQSKFRPRMEDGRFVSARTSTVIEFRYDPAFMR
jgi:TonB family protein